MKMDLSAGDNMLSVACVIISLFIQWTALDIIGSGAEEHPKGHMEPLGSHRPPEGSIEERTSFPHPAEFFETYVKGSKPVLFKGAAKGIPAFNLWTDKYLSSKYGHVDIECEIGKKENRSAEATDMTMEGFISAYKKRDIYMVQDVYPQMRVDLSMPRCLQCGGFQNNLDLVVMWFSSGGTNSVLHSDSIDNINCLFAGEKDLVMFDKKHRDDVEADHFVEEKGFSNVDVDKVDMYKYPKLRDLPWYKAHMDPGDCLFIPIFWYHQVHSSKTRNLAVNLWFNHILWFNHSDCEHQPEPLAEYKPLHHYNVAMFMGEGDSLEKVRTDLFGRYAHLDKITIEDMKEEWEFDDEDMQMLFEIADENRDMELSWEEVYKVDLMDLLQDFPELLPPGADEELQETLAARFEEDDYGRDEL